MQKANNPYAVAPDEIASLAKLRLTPAERERLLRELPELIAFAAGLDAPDEARDAAVPEKSALRPDAPAADPTFDRAIMRADAPVLRDGCFVVPAVVTEDAG